MSDISDLSDLSSMSDEEHMAPVKCQYQSLGSWSLFRCPELIVPEAFVQHPMRIPSQLAAATGKPLEKVMSNFDELLGGTSWRDDPTCITPRVILQYAEESKASAYMYQGGRLVQFEQRPNTAELAIVFNIWGGLVYFYKGMGPRARDDAQRKSHPAKPRQQRAELLKAVRHPPKPVEEFQAFPWHLELADVPPGPGRSALASPMQARAWGHSQGSSWTQFYRSDRGDT